MRKCFALAGAVACVLFALSPLAGCDNKPATDSGASGGSAPASAQPEPADQERAARYVQEAAPAVAAPPAAPPGHSSGAAPVAPANAAADAPPARTADAAVPGAAPPVPVPAAVPSGKLKIAAPDSWVSQPPANTMRYAQYVVPRVEGDPEDAQLVVFVNIGGGAQANIDRWKTQFTDAQGTALPPDAARQSEFDASGMKVTMIDVTGRYTATAMGPGAPAPAPKDNFRMLGAVVETPAGPFYFRLTGPAATIASQEDAFMKLLQSLSL